MAWNQIDGKHEYLVSPTEYNINDNEAHSTYDQFIQLRDTLIFSWKYYNNKAWCKLIVWGKEDWKTTTNTIEVIFKNWFKLSFEPNYASDPDSLMTLQTEWPYVTWLAKSEIPTDIPLANQYGLRAVRINQDWHYLMFHKEQIGSDANPIPNTVKQVWCYLDYFAYNPETKTYPAQWIPIAVFDWKIDFSKTFAGTFSWSTSWTDPNGSCSWTTSTPIKLTLWDLFTKITSFGYNERNLKKNDILVLMCVDQDGNELPYQEYSNFLQVNYVDLTLNE